jgi:hypothetical protein
MGYRADLDAAVGRVDRLRREVERTNDDLSKEIRAWAGDGDKAMARRRARDRLGAGTDRTEPRRGQAKLRAEGKSGSGEFSRGEIRSRQIRILDSYFSDFFCQIDRIQLKLAGF